MRKARHATWAHWIFRPYLRYLFRRFFYSVEVLGSVPQIPEGQSILLLPNHSSWWDGFIIYLVNDLLWEKTPFVMMEEKQLKRFPFFNRVGAFSIRPGDRKDVEDSLDYTAGLLEDPSHLVFLFPQGELLPWHRRPLVFRQGFQKILTKTRGTPVVMLCGIRLEYTVDQRARIFLAFREAGLPPDGIAEEMEEMLGDMERWISRGETGLRIFSGKKSPGE